ncbi:MAG: N-acetyltransferase family protein [Sphingomonadaceae bacterium]
MVAQPPRFTITALAPDGFDAFLVYLNDHLGDNGRDEQPYFQPLSRTASYFPPERADAFRRGLQQALGTPGWRRLWVARTADGQIAGHIDLRAHPEPAATHRCMLGMGVGRHWRRHGLGRQLIAHARLWASHVALVWIDLQVLSVNQPALSLYQHSGFETTGVTPDMFRLDGHSFSYTAMSLHLAD